MKNCTWSPFFDALAGAFRRKRGPEGRPTHASLIEGLEMRRLFSTDFAVYTSVGLDASLSTHSFLTQASVGHRVRANTNLNVRPWPGADWTVGTEAGGATGTVVDGPSGEFYDGAYYNWLQVQWDDGLFGWLVQDGLSQVVGAPSQQPYIRETNPSMPEAIDGRQHLAVYGGDFDDGAYVSLSDPTGDFFTLSGDRVIYRSNSEIVVDPNFTAGGAGEWQVEVVNGDGATSGWFTFQVVAPWYAQPPSISGINPSEPEAISGRQHLSIYASNIDDGAYINLSDPSGDLFTLSGERVVYRSDSEIVVDPNFTANGAGEWQVQVVNASGLMSSWHAFQVIRSAPVQSPSISSINPGEPEAIDGRQHLSIYASNIDSSGAYVVLYDPAGASFTLDDGRIIYRSDSEIVIDPNFTANGAGAWQVEVVNGDRATSERFTFQVVAPWYAQPPSITGINPTQPRAMDGRQTVRIYGSRIDPTASFVNFYDPSGQQYRLDGDRVYSRSNSEIVVDPNFTAGGEGTWRVEVVNGDGSSSGPFVFQVAATSVAPPVDPPPGTPTAPPVDAPGVPDDEHETPSDTVYPNDGYIERINFRSDSVGVELTLKGLQQGVRTSRSRELAKRVRAWHSNHFDLTSRISHKKLGWQIQAHCIAYWAGVAAPLVAAGLMPVLRPYALPAALLARLGGEELIEHANPVDVTWEEILV